MLGYRVTYLLLGPVLLGSTLLLGCTWQDDFRSRIQPRPPVPDARSNHTEPDFSGTYEHDASEVAAESTTPDIDQLSILPEVPEHPLATE
jgi:hypothetical protein